MDMKALREQMGLSQTELAEHLDVTVSTISLWEAGKREPRPARAWALIELADSYGIRLKLEDIFPRDNGG